MSVSRETSCQQADPEQRAWHPWHREPKVYVEGATITRVESMPSSRNGNPRWRLTLTEPGQPLPVVRPTEVDGSVGYEVTEGWVGRRVDLACHRHGSIWAVRDHDTRERG